MRATKLWLDLETRSEVDLGVQGIKRYAMDITTECICMSYAFNDEDVKTWFAEDEELFPKEVIAYIEYTENPIYAHNASFERHMFDYVLSNDYDFKPPALDRWRCTSAAAMAHGLPGKLEDICIAIKLPIKKQEFGSKLINDYSKPGFLTEWKPGDKDLMQQYCEDDVRTMRMFCSILRELEDYEWAQYHLTEEINDRGVPVDVEFAKAALNYAEHIKEDVSERIIELTEGFIKKPTERKNRDIWLKEKLSEELLEVITVVKEDKDKNLVEKISFDEAHRTDLAEHIDCPKKVGDFIELVNQVGGSTISKYKAMINKEVEGRVHGSLIWSGAGATGRFSSRGLQLQNFKRNVMDDPEVYIKSIKEGIDVERPAEVMSRLIRAAIYSKKGITFGDYSQIEGRIMPWLSLDPRAEKVLDIFRNDGLYYEENAVWMFNFEDVTKVPDEYRQKAKVACLSCQFGGGAPLGDIRDIWRQANPWCMPFCMQLENAAKEAVRNPGDIQTAGRIQFLYDGGDWLWLRLPSGRCLAYFQPRFEVVESDFGEQWALTCLKGSAKPKKGESWPRRVLHYLVLANNSTQGTAADIMREALIRADSEGINTLFTVHDETVAEGYVAEELTRIMEVLPEWAEGLPIKAETKMSERYGK